MNNERIIYMASFDDNIIKYTQADIIVQSERNNSVI